MPQIKPYPIWPWICTTLSFGALAFSFSAMLEIERRYLQFMGVEAKGLTTWGREDGINPDVHRAKLESTYDSVSGEVKLFALLSLVALVVTIVYHVLHNRRIRAQGGS